MGLASDPLVTVVMPAFDAASTIEDQLSGLARQRLDGPWEVLVCDNGSTDGTAEIVRRWVDRLPLRVVDASARRGPAAARNVGVDEARAPLIAFCDADDVVADGWLEGVVAALGTGEVVAAGARYRALHSTPRRPEYVCVTTHRAPHLVPLPIVGAGHMAIRASVLREVGGFDETLRTGEDCDLSWRLQLAGHSIVEQPSAVIDVRRRSGVAAVFRQAYQRGAGDRQLRHKYRHVIAVLREAPRPTPLGPTNAQAAAAAPPPAQAPRRGGRERLERLRRSLRTPADVAALVARTSSRISVTTADRLGSALGLRFGPFDPTAPQLDPAAFRLDR